MRIKKLNKQQRKEIKEAYANGADMKTLANKLGVATSTVYYHAKSSRKKTAKTAKTAKVTDNTPFQDAVLGVLTLNLPNSTTARLIRALCD